MPSTPRPGRAGKPRRGMGGLLGLLAVLAFLILAAVIVTRRAPERVADAPAPSPMAPPPTTLALAPSEPAPSPSDPPASAASPEPAVVAVPSPPPGKPARTSRAVSAPAGNPRVVAGPGPAGRQGAGIQPPAGSAPRRFILGTTSIESLKPVPREIAGFEAGGVGVKRAPEVDGRVELEMDPAQVRPGVDYKVKVYLANDGDKDIPVEEIKVSTTEDGKSASRALPVRARSVKPRQRVLLHEVEGVWRENARSWAMEVVVTSSRKDVYRNRLRWE